jgi:hypothetical protein
LDDCSAQVFPYNIFAYCSICRVDCKFARKKKEEKKKKNAYRKHYYTSTSEAKVKDVIEG